MSDPVRVRFAPSPTGFLHVGNARTALFNWLFARHQGASSGRFVLRIEDTDEARSTAASETAILEDLRWLGLDWDEGPDRPGPAAPYRQSERRPLYDDAARRLVAQGRAYRCFCAQEALEEERARQREAGLPPRYSGRCRALDSAESSRRAASEPFSLRFDAEGRPVAFDDLIRGRVEFPGSQVGDPVIVRSDGSPTYNFAVVVDDLAMGITHVIRGEDHISNTPRQILMYEAFGAPAPRFAHASMVLGPDGHPLSKRHGASSVSDFRARGALPEALVNYLALLGWSDPQGREVLSRDELVAAFELGRVGRAAATFDMAKLEWLNGQWLRRAEPARLARLCAPALKEAGFLPEGDPGEAAARWLQDAMEAFVGQLTWLNDAPGAMAGLFRFRDTLGPGGEESRIVRELSSEPAARAVIAAFAEGAAGLEPPGITDREVFRKLAGEAGRRAGVKGRALFHPLRLALTASEAGPELDRLVPLIDRGAALSLPEPIPDCAQRAGLVAGLLAGG